MHKSVEKFISKLAKKMPDQKYVTRRKHTVRGDELHASAQMINEQGNRMQHFMVPVETKHNVNHKRRMKQAYNDEGVDGLIGYVIKRTKPAHHDFMRNYIKQYLS